MCPLRHDGQPAWQYELQPPKPELTVGHIPVLRDEAVDALLASAGGTGGVYVDGTFGRGGHSTEILRRLAPHGRLIAFDVDPSALEVGQELARQDTRFAILHAPFGDLATAAAPGVLLSGVLLDIGFSSPQMDEGHRGWSVMRDGPLDLRMNPRASMPASLWLQGSSVPELAWVFRELGDDTDPILAQRMAESVLEQQRRCGAFTSTMQLGGGLRHVLRNIRGSSSRSVDVKLPMRALTSFVNQEMEQLVQALSGAFQRLQAGGRIVVITFKPLEEAVVQRFLRAHEAPPATGVLSLERAGATLAPERMRELFPLLGTQHEHALRRVCEPLYTSGTEVARNRRSRSAALQVLEKVPWPRRPPDLPRTATSQPAKEAPPSDCLAFPPRGDTVGDHRRLVRVQAPALCATQDFVARHGGRSRPPAAQGGRAR